MPLPSYTTAFVEAKLAEPDWDLRRGSDVLAALSSPGFSITRRSADPGVDDGLGKLYNLPKWVEPKSIIHRQDWVNEGAFQHPAVPIAMGFLGEVKAYFCCPVTSFGERNLTEKFRPIENSLERLPFDKQLEKTSPLNSWMPIQGEKHDAGLLMRWVQHEDLRLQSGQMPKKSYVNLDQGYWIEASKLGPWAANEPVKLTGASLNRLQWSYHKAELYRITFGNPTRVRTGSPSPSRPLKRPQGHWARSPTSPVKRSSRCNSNAQDHAPRGYPTPPATPPPKRTCFNPTAAAFTPTGLRCP